MKTKNNKFKFFIILVLAFLFLNNLAQGKTSVVCPSGCDYSSIQSAIDSANIGDTIEVQSGTYKENVNVTKQLILRGVDTGAGKPVVDAGGSGSAITLSADGITLEGFEARNSGKKSGDAGIKATSDNNVIKNNNVSLNNKGIYLIYSSNNSIISNNISKNYFGIVLSDSNNNTISGNNINNNNEFHIYNSNTIKNTTYNSSIVICVYPEGVGLLLLDSDHNIIYLNNFINNLYNTANCFSTNLIWNSTKKINYTYRNTTYINYLGNYWSDYTGTDADDDGIGDTPHGGDNYPLMERFENYFPEENQQPIAYFTYSPLNSVVNQTITFNASLSYDIDGNIILYEWKFGDNTTKEGVIVTHSYLKAGSYTVTLTVKDNFGEKNSTSKMVSVKANLIKNGDFSDGLNNWTERGYGRGNRQVKVVYDDAINSSVLEFKRWNSGADGGMVGVYQNLSINVNEYKEIYLEADVKVISNTLGDSGWWSYVYGGDGEFPVHLYLYYEDENGTDWVWTHGFLPVKDYWNRTNYDIVNRSEWYHYISPNLVFLKTTTTKPHNVPIPSPPPKKITGIFLGGKGWDFSGRIDNVKLNIKAEDTTPPSSITNLQSTAGLTWINWTWKNPMDADFSHTMIYLDGVFKVNTSLNYYNATNLKEGTEYTLSTRTVDKSGNINQSWVNGSASTLQKWLKIKTDKKNYSLGENLVLSVEVNYTGNPIFVQFELELQEPYGAIPDPLLKTKFIPLNTGFYKEVNLTCSIPVSPLISEGEYTFKIYAIDGFGVIRASDQASFYINDSMPSSLRFI